jgi:hypothetical protein
MRTSLKNVGLAAVVALAVVGSVGAAYGGGGGVFGPGGNSGFFGGLALGGAAGGPYYAEYYGDGDSNAGYYGYGGGYNGGGGGYYSGGDGSDCYRRVWIDGGGYRRVRRVCY